MQKRRNSSFFIVISLFKDGGAFEPVLHECADALRIYLRIVEIGGTMIDAGKYPELLVSDFRFVQPVNHFHRDDRVLVAVNEQHRQPASVHGIERRSLCETPSVEDPAPKVR